MTNGLIRYAIKGKGWEMKKTIIFLSMFVSIDILHAADQMSNIFKQSLPILYPILKHDQETSNQNLFEFYIDGKKITDKSVIEKLYPRTPQSLDDAATPEGFKIKINLDAVVKAAPQLKQPTSSTWVSRLLNYKILLPSALVCTCVVAWMWIKKHLQQADIPFAY